VLVVDDDPKSVELIAIQIQDLATQVFRAYGGREAIEIAERELPDLIVLDLMMPEVNGFDVVDALNRNPATASIPLIIVTAFEITAEERERLDGGVLAVMGKAGSTANGSSLKFGAR
jgi:CheY-like chemotaxis protein